MKTYFSAKNPHRTVDWEFTSPDGFQCRQVSSTVSKIKGYEVFCEGEWRRTEDAAKFYPELTACVLRCRIRNRRAIRGVTLQTLANMRISLWGKSGTCTDWANNWAIAKKIKPTRDLHRRFKAMLIAEHERDTNAPLSEALEKTLRAFKG